MKKYSSSSFWIRLINSKIFMILVIFLIIGVGYAIYGELNNQGLIKSNIGNLEKERVVLENENINLVELLAYYKSDDYIETEARQKLNMARVGEHVVIVPDNQNLTEQNKKDNKFENMKNWELWIEYFFGGRM